MILPKRDRASLAALLRRWAARLERAQELPDVVGLCEFFWDAWAQNILDTLQRDWCTRTLRELYGEGKGYYEYFWPTSDWQSRVKALVRLAEILEAQS